MQERVSQAGGALMIHSNGNGTSVLVELPIRSANANAPESISNGTRPKGKSRNSQSLPGPTRE
jgi:hypothetical protein